MVIGKYVFSREILNNKRVFNLAEETIVNAGDRSQTALTGNKGFVLKICNSLWK